MLLPESKSVATSLNRIVSGGTFPTLSSLDKPVDSKVWKRLKLIATEVLNQPTEANFQHCFQQWKSRMERCRDRQGEYIEGEKVATVIGNE
ncbi:hypothetical protein NQ318_009491 [Aromia moschata]|uniref:Uncharacterized protein n=1 Tax=Aromia moschata TaxID=1265417 RepID=A0AAV8Z7Y2_9CUCU|nr:hypothetical protein NQ318_009491 [Aromia moschata]